MAPHTTMNNQRILVIDDEPDLRTLYELTLLREGYQVDTADTLAHAQEVLSKKTFDLVITDMRLPDGMGIEILKTLRERQRSERCVVITAYGSAENAVESLKAGAFDYLTKPVDLKQFRTVIATAIQDRHHTRDVPKSEPMSLRSYLHADDAEAALALIAGKSYAMCAVKERIAKVARSMAPVLVCGESGTGKELVANALHANSHRAKGPWVAVNCGAIPESLLEAEFFGSKKGAFTGAHQDREGFFRTASGGTLFLDEIGDLPLAMQAKLLRAIQERCIRPIGASVEEPVDVRIVSATHKDLPNEVAAGRFRQDLFYRLNVIDIHIPPLRERIEDIPELCRALVERIAKDSGRPAPSLTPQFLTQVAQLPLQGNVRELENLLHRAFALSDGNDLRLDEHPSTPSRPIPIADTSLSNPSTTTQADTLPADLQAHLDQQEREILVRTLKETGFNRTLAATRLGLSLRQIRYRMTRLKIDSPQSPEDDSEA